MPHFFVDTDDGELVVDYIGIDAPTAGEAARMATSALPELAAENFPEGGRWIISVRDESGRCVFKAALVLLFEWPEQPPHLGRYH
jgi:hypothetical protein